jgi:hypothetical protein
LLAPLFANVIYEDEKKLKSSYKDKLTFIIAQINMKKEELVHLHLLLAQLKKYCEETGLDCDFTKYNELDISPFQMHRSKEEHKQAVFVLGTELVASMAMNTRFSENKETLEGILKNPLSLKKTVKI